MKGTKLIVSIGLILVLVLSTILAACAQEAAAPGAPTRISPQVPTQPTTPTAPTTPTKPAPAKPAPAPEAEVIKWVCQNSFGGPPFSQFGQTWADKVEELTDGQIDITYHMSGAIVPAYEETGGVIDGIIDVACIGMDQSRGRLGDQMDFFGYNPFYFDALDYLFWYSQYGGLEILDELTQSQGVKMRPIQIAGPEHFAWANFKITSVEDIKGIKYRTMSSLFQAVIAELGGVPTAMPGSETFTALQTGVIDAAEYSGPAMDFATGFQDICKYVHSPGIHQPASIGGMIMTSDTWNGLTPYLQILIDTASDWAFLQNYLWSVKADQEAVIKIMDAGVEYVILSPEFQTQLRKVYDGVVAEKTAKDPTMQRLWDSHVTYINSAGDYKQKFISSFNPFAE